MSSFNPSTFTLHLQPSPPSTFNLHHLHRSSSCQLNMTYCHRLKHATGHALHTTCTTHNPALHSENTGSRLRGYLSRWVRWVSVVHQLWLQIGYKYDTHKNLTAVACSLFHCKLGDPDTVNTSLLHSRGENQLNGRLYPDVIAMSWKPRPVSTRRPTRISP